MASPNELLSYLRIMSSISGKATPLEKAKGFHDVLLLRIENLKVVLSKNSQLSELKARLESQWKNDRPDQMRWTFVNTCLELMRELKRSLMALKAKEKCDVSKETIMTEVVPLPADALSVSDQNTVLTTIQFIVTLGMCPNLLPGVGVPLQKRSEFAHLLISPESIKSEKRLYDCLNTLLNCIEHPQLGSIILSRHLPDILSGLLQISYAPLSAYSEHNKANQSNCKESKNETKENVEPESIGQPTDQCCNVLNPGDVHVFAHNQVSSSQDQNQGVFITPSEREKCLFDLQRLLDRIYQPMVIRELLILQAGLGNVQLKASETTHSRKEHKRLPGTPKWLRDVCGLLLSERLMKPHGVKAVLLGVLEGSEGVSCPPNWKKCDTIAKLIANCPSQAKSVEEYYKQVSPQVLGLLHGPTDGLGRLLIRAASSVIREMFTQYPELTQKYVMSLITGPLEKTTEGECASIYVDESTISQSVEDIHRVFVLGSHQIGLTFVWPVVHPIFELFCFCRKSISHLRSCLRDILVDVIRRTDPEDALKLLYSLAFKQTPSRTFSANTSSINTTLNHSCKQLHGATKMFPIKLMSDSFVISHGDGGGLTIRYQSSGDDKRDEIGNIVGNLKGDLLSNSEARAVCVVELLDDLKKDNVAGDFFIYLMQELTCIVLDYSKDTTNSDLFEYGEAVSSQHRLLVLNHVALMCEKLGPSILTSTPQVLSFIKSTFQRGCTIINVHDQEVGATFITETVSMALGMLSAILGGAVKIEQDQQALLQDLLPLLDVLATVYPASEVQQMASDLRVVIATRGAVWSHRIEKRSDNLRNMVDSRDDEEKGVTSDGTRLAGCDFDEAFVQLCDPLVPVRGHAIMRMASLVHQRHPKAMESADILLKIFLDQLTHDDSYIYLAAIQGLVSLADIRPDTVVPRLAHEFAHCRNQGSRVSVEGTDAELRGHYLSDRGDSTTRSQRAWRSPELRMKLGEALVKATRTCGDLLPRYTQQLLPALLSGVKDSEPLVRASSLSNLGDVCQRLRFSLGLVLNEIFSCVTAVLKTDESVEVRRAAVLVITLLLRGLGRSAIQVVDTYLKPMYQLLKFVESTDLDVLTRAHAQAALGELDTITREYLFPKPSFTKHIQVLP